MKQLLGRFRPVKAASLVALVLVLTGPALPAAAQDTLAESRLRRMETEIRALQRQVFPGGDGKYFAPEITSPTAAGAAGSGGASGPPATTPVTELLSRMEAIEAQMSRLTAQVEQNTNKISQIETRLGINPAETAAPAPTPTPTASPVPAADSNLSAMTGGASAPKPKPDPAATAAPAPAPAAAAPKPAASKPSASKPAGATATAAAAAAATAAAPSAERVAAVRAIVKPQSDDPGDDEYSYGFRLWEAKFYPEAQQQLKLMIDRYPRYARISYARNLLGRAYLDDGKPRDAATWFLQNYQGDKTGARAPDSLLLLAESMRRLNDTKRACIAIAEFGETYAADAAGRLKAQYDTTRAAVKCNK